ncbi:hypothetical protein ABZ930_07495 [Streptomyces sp. NPDC046716]|uniref:hypothetical protein n=1 Tax=Streptomyces sp. NPDC046716 TaxID=3157093 RepID=UPI0033F37994
MVSFPEDFEAREAAARRLLEELRAETAELALRLQAAQEDLSRWEISRETVTKVLAELSAAEPATEVDVPVMPEQKPSPTAAGKGRRPCGRSRALRASSGSCCAFRTGSAP